MKRVATSELTPGMIAAEDVSTYAGQLIITKGTVLTDKVITKLEFYSIINIRVEDELDPSAVVKPAAQDSELSYSERIKQSPEFIEFKTRFEDEVVKFQKMLNGFVNGSQVVNIESLYQFTSSLLLSESGYINVFDMLHSMRNYDDLTYVHSINVALMTNVFARWLHMSDEEIKMATLCGLLHDIGKISVPSEIIQKPGKLTDSEYNIVKKHTLEGYNVLKSLDVPIAIMNAALMHHERCDGSGYPLGITNAKIDTYAKMVAIVDVYDAMTSARVYRGPMCPFTVVDIFETEGLQKYDTRYIMTFLENIVNTYMLHRVKLSDGRIGDVVFINRSSLANPTIKCGREFIDLSAEPELHIEAII